MEESPLPEDATEPTSEVEEEEEDEEDEVEGNEKQEDEKDENDDCKSSQLKPKKKRRKKKKKSDPKPATSVKKKISEQGASGARVAKNESLTSQLSEAGSVGKVEDLDSDLDDVTDASEDTGHVTILRDTVKNLTRTVVQLSDENARLLKENKMLKKEIAKSPPACSSPKVVGDTTMVGALDVRLQSLEKAMKKLKASKNDASPASASSQMHQMKQQMLKIVQQSNAHIMSVDKLKAAQQGEVERFDDAVNDLRQSMHAKDDAQKQELEKFKAAMETFVKEKTKTLETSVKVIEGLNVQAIETIKNIQEKADASGTTDVNSQTLSSTAFG